MARLKSLKYLLFLSTVFLFFELIARGAFYLYPGETYQKYICHKYVKSNGSSAKGDLYRGQSFKIAFIGTSYLAGENLYFHHTVTQKIKDLLGTDKVHIDNFSIGNMNKEALVLQLKSLHRKKRRYDIIIFSINHSTTFRKHFLNRWRGNSRLMLAQFWQRRKEKKLEPLFELSKNKQTTPIDESKEREKLLKKALQGQFVIDTRFSTPTHPKIINNLVNLKISKTSHYKKYEFYFGKKTTKEEIAYIKKLLDKVSDKAFFISILPAYYPSMLSSYRKIYTIIMPASDFQVSAPSFYDIPTIYNIFKLRADHDSAISKEYGIETLHYHNHIFSAMTSTKGLFIDHLHPSSKGAEIIAKYFAEKFAPLIKEKLKIETNQ